ncbi:hypothetical protein [Cerasicoccus maritimus]|uniref:hypothetical protein n=1 Tax=Cerasicoccus maritimus TaxID=490089 RepID=UPI002852AACF|nr:hypothetical protein [Cerasicoccus maritimus]
MINKWKKMSRGDRIRTQLLISFGVIALYIPFYLGTSKKLFESERMLNRRADRIEKRTGLEGIDATGPTIRTIQKRIAEADTKLHTVNEKYTAMSAGFASLESTEEQHQLMLEISTLAERTGVNVISVAREGSVIRNGQPGQIPVDRELGRPVIEVTARAQFYALLNFLHELDALTYHAAVVNLKLYSKNPNNQSKSTSPEASPGLFIQMEIAL